MIKLNYENGSEQMKTVEAAKARAQALVGKHHDVKWLAYDANTIGGSCRGASRGTVWFTIYITD